MNLNLEEELSRLRDRLPRVRGLEVGKRAWCGWSPRSKAESVCGRLGKQAGSQFTRPVGHIAKIGLHLKCNGKTLEGFMLCSDMI